MALDPDSVILREHYKNSDGGMILVSREIKRQPRGQKPIEQLLREAMKTPEIKLLPFPGAVYCTHCGTFQRESAFPRDRRRKRGFGDWCNSCHAEYSRKWRAEQAAIEGREIRPYRRRQMAA